ncbi:MAG: hypothetical protein QXS37_06315 [Candidatus Aenigmatarchaeota archaeon]
MILRIFKDGKLIAENKNTVVLQGVELIYYALSGQILSSIILNYAELRLGDAQPEHVGLVYGTVTGVIKSTTNQITYDYFQNIQDKYGEIKTTITFVVQGTESVQFNKVLLCHRESPADIRLFAYTFFPETQQIAPGTYIFEWTFRFNL